MQENDFLAVDWRGTPKAQSSVPAPRHEGHAIAIFNQNRPPVAVSTAKPTGVPV